MKRRTSVRVGEGGGEVEAGREEVAEKVRGNACESEMERPGRGPLKVESE